ATRTLRLDGVSLVSVRILDGPRRSLGARRNLSVERARGRYGCQWDDDDLHAQTRVTAQMAALVGAQATACTLERLTFYDRRRASAFCSFARAEGWDG